MALAIDIETMERLHVSPLPPITCICMYDAKRDQKYKLRFWKISEQEREDNKMLVLTMLDQASCIIGYNVVFFDLEFIKRTFPDCVDNKRMSSWVVKAVDPFMLLKFIFKNTCKLDVLLTLNHLSSKSGSGSNAIVLAQEERWQELLDYCMDDTMLTYQLFSRGVTSSIEADTSDIKVSPAVFAIWENVLSSSNGPKFISMHYHTSKSHQDEHLNKKWEITDISSDAVQRLLSVDFNE